MCMYLYTQYPTLFQNHKFQTVGFFDYSLRSLKIKSLLEDVIIIHFQKNLHRKKSLPICGVAVIYHMNQSGGKYCTSSSNA